MKLFFITAFAFTCICTSAQKKTNFSSENYAGLLEGEHGSSLNYKQLTELSLIIGLLAWEQVSTGIIAGASPFLLLLIRISLKKKRGASICPQMQE